jgi:hypothetical protein
VADTEPTVEAEDEGPIHPGVRHSVRYREKVQRAQRVITGAEDVFAGRETFAILTELRTASASPDAADALAFNVSA